MVVVKALTFAEWIEKNIQSYSNVLKLDKSIKPNRWFLGKVIELLDDSAKIAIEPVAGGAAEEFFNAGGSEVTTLVTSDAVVQIPTISVLHEQFVLQFNHQIEFSREKFQVGAEVFFQVRELRAHGMMRRHVIHGLIRVEELIHRLQKTFPSEKPLLRISYVQVELTEATNIDSHSKPLLTALVTSWNGFDEFKNVLAKSTWFKTKIQQPPQHLWKYGVLSICKELRSAALFPASGYSYYAIVFEKLVSDNGVLKWARSHDEHVELRVQSFWDQAAQDEFIMEKLVP